MLFQPTTEHNKGNKLDVSWQLGVATRTNEIMVISPDGNQRAWTFRRGASRQKMGCRSGDERERIAIWDGVRIEGHWGPVDTEAVDRPHARHVLTMPFWVRHKDIEPKKDSQRKGQN